MTKLPLIAFFYMLSFVSKSQNFLYLEEIQLKKKPDFVEHEKTVIKAVDYLFSTPIDENNMDRKLCTRFIIRYAEKTPFLTMSLDGSVLTLSEHNKDFLQMYMGYWLKSALTNKDKTDTFHKIEIYSNIAEYAKKGNNVILSAYIESLINAFNSNEVDEWIKQNN